MEGREMDDLFWMDVFDDVNADVKKKLRILWPANSKTPPTESNLVLSFASVLAARGYTVFSEVPFKGDDGDGRIDLVAIHRFSSDIILFEAKSDKQKFEQEMNRDWERLKSFTLDCLPDNKAWVNEPGKNLKKHICVGFWSENKSKILDDKWFEFLNTEGKSYQCWIDGGLNLGVKFFYKSF
jgi:hypothetical protein